MYCTTAMSCVMFISACVSNCYVLLYVQEYVNKHKQHPFLPVTRVAQGQHNLQFEAAFDDNAPVSEINNVMVSIITD